MLRTKWHLSKDGSHKVGELELHASKSAWENIVKFIDNVEDTDEEKRKKRVTYLKETSREMTKDWKNCVYQKKLPLREQRQQRLEEKHRIIDENRMDELRLQQEERRKYMEAKRRSLFLRESMPRRLSNALLLAETQFENEQQIKLNEMIKQHGREVDAMFAEKLKENAAADLKEIEKEKNQEEETKRNLAQNLTTQICVNKQRKLKQREEKLKEDLDDYVKTSNELERIKQIEQEEALQRKRTVLADLKESFENKANFDKMMKQVEQDHDFINATHNTAMLKIDCKRKKKMKDDQAFRTQSNEPFIKRMEELEKAKAQKEEEMLHKAVTEKDKLEAEALKKKQEFARQVILDQIEDRRQCREREEEKMIKEEKLKRWELLNRIKTTEVVAKYEDIRKNEEWQKTLKYRDELIKQMAEREEDKRQELENDVRYRQEKKAVLLDQDKKFFDYADEVKSVALSKGRVTFPIEKVINEYKKYHSIVGPQDFHRERRNKFCENQECFLNRRPGKMAHHPSSDPNYKKLGK